MRKIHFFSFCAFLALLLSVNASHAQNAKAVTVGTAPASTIQLTYLQEPNHKITVAIENIKPSKDGVDDVDGVYHIAADDIGNLYVVSQDETKIYKAPSATAASISNLLQLKK